LLLIIVSNRFHTIYDVFSTEKKKVCFHDSLRGVMERKYPTNVDDFRNSSVNDTERLHDLQSNDQCDGVVISRYSLSFISTQAQSSCDSLYPLYDEDLFTQEVIVAVSQTLGELGDELINVMDIMASKNLYQERHDDIVSSLTEGCEFQAVNGRKGVVWESFFAPMVFSGALVVIAFVVGCMKYKNRQKSMQSESSSPQSTVEPEEELASLLDNGDDLNKFSSEVKRLNEESEERITERIMKRITVDNEHVIKQITYDNECVIKRITDDNECVIKRIIDNECMIKRITDDNESIMKQITYDNECAMKQIADDVMRQITECIEEKLEA